MLTLEDLKNSTEAEVKQHLVDEYTGNGEWLKDAEVLVAYESVGSWGCDSSGFFLLRKDGQLYEQHGSHCSCYGFEDQWSPEVTTLEYLRSENFYMPTGGYDDNRDDNTAKVVEFIKELEG